MKRANKNLRGRGGASRLLLLIGASAGALLTVPAAVPNSDVHSPDTTATVSVSPPAAAVNVSPPAASASVSAPAPAANTNPSGQPSPYPAGVGEIVKMMNAGVDNNIIKAYIHGSFMYWNLSSQDIINLKQQGFPSDLMAAMLQRDSELRDQAMQAAQANPNPPSTTTDYGTNVPTVATPTYDSGQYAGNSAYPVDYSYPDYGYSYPYPAYWGGWGWGWGWPVWGGGFVFFNSFGHCQFNRNFHVNNFHNNSFHNNFHNNNFHNNNFHGNNFHGNTAWNSHNGTGTWRGNSGTTMARGNNSRFQGNNLRAFGTANGLSGFSRSTTVTRSTPSATTRRTTSGFAGTRSGAFGTPSFGGRMGSTSRSFGSAGMGSRGHFGGGSMGHIGGGSMGGGFRGGGGGMHMGGSFGGGHGGGGGGHR
jgi:hypothetical protein